LATWIYERFRVSVVRACRLARLQRASWYYRSRARDQSALRMRIRDIAQARPRFGYQRIHIMLRREGWHVNRKRIHRLYRLDGLQVRMRVRPLSNALRAFHTRVAVRSGLNGRHGVSKLGNAG
jgi:transposase InsO family protein